MCTRTRIHGLYDASCSSSSFTDLKVDKFIAVMVEKVASVAGEEKANEVKRWEELGGNSPSWKGGKRSSL